MKAANTTARYVAAYVAKPPAPIGTLPKDAALQWLDANRRSHWLIQWGRALPPAKDHLVDELPNDWEHVGYLEYIITHLPDWSSDLKLAPALLRQRLAESEVVAYDETRPP